MKKINLVCIQCPIGCNISVEYDEEENKIVNIYGNNCDKGKKYAIQEIIMPLRIIPTSIKVINGELEIVSVKTSAPIPKEIIFKIMEKIKNYSVNAPVHIGDILINNILGTGIDIVATKNINKKK